MAPVVIAPACHSQIDMPAMVKMRMPLSNWSDVVISVDTRSER